MSADLRQQPLRAVLRRLPKKNCPKPQPAADRFLQHAQPFNGAISLSGALGAGKCLPQLLQQRIVPPLNAPQSRLRARRFTGSGHE
jgi:hypothetical protein